MRGALPRELDGQLVRNGHNPKPGVVPIHWFQGSGMLHGIRLRDGRAEAYRNRWVRTPALEGAPYMTERGPDLTAHTAGTAIGHAGRILALNEAGLPFQVTLELDTVGAFDFAGKLTTAMGAHPKIDPRTGELHFFGYGPFPPYLTYYVASPKGDVVRAEVVPGAGPSLMHDFAITRRHIVWFDMPVVFDNNTSGMLDTGRRPCAPCARSLTPRCSTGGAGRCRDGSPCGSTTDRSPVSHRRRPCRSSWGHVPAPDSSCRGHFSKQ